MIACSLSPLEANRQRRAWVNASTSIVKLEVETGCTVFMDGGHIDLAWQWSATQTGLWWLIHQCTLWDLAVGCFLVNEKLDLWLRFACLPFSTVISQVFWQECLIEMPVGLTHSVVGHLGNLGQGHLSKNEYVKWVYWGQVMLPSYVNTHCFITVSIHCKGALVSGSWTEGPTSARKV